MFNLLVSGQILGLKLGLQMNAWLRIIILDLNLACSFKQLMITLLSKKQQQQVFLQSVATMSLD